MKEEYICDCCSCLMLEEDIAHVEPAIITDTDWIQQQYLCSNCWDKYNKELEELNKHWK